MVRAVLVHRVLLLAVTAVCVAVGGLAWRRRPRKGAVPLAGMMAGAAVWNLGIFAESLPLGFAFQRAMTPVVYLGVSAAVLFAVVFALEFAGLDRLLTRRTLAALSVEPVLAVVLAATNYGNLFWTSVDPSKTVYTGAAFARGPGFWLHAGYSYLALVVVSALILRRLYRSGSLYRRQGAAILVAVLSPWVGNALYLADVSAVGQTAGFAVMGVALFLGLFRFRLVEVAPVARAAVVDELDAGVLVLDEEDRIVDVDPDARELLGIGDVDVVGRPVGSLPDAGRFPAEGAVELVRPDRDGTRRTLRIRAAPFGRGAGGARRGRVLLVDDVTERERRERELRRRNERLEEFASLVSHDLRNPLNVAQGHLDLLEAAVETGDDPDSDAGAAVGEVRAAHDRMEALVEDVLALAREGRRVTDPEPVDLAAVARDAWRAVETGDADLAVRTDARIRADRSRLRRVFENLFRNSIDHAGTDDDPPSLTVGDLEGAGNDDPLSGGTGFYVADDGPGIPEADREAVFEAGHTTAEEGTGLGLSIVRTAVEAHGWDVAVTDADGGGARFEVSGVSPADSRGIGDGDAGGAGDGLAVPDGDPVRGEHRS